MSPSTQPLARAAQRIAFPEWPLAALAAGAAAAIAAVASRSPLDQLTARDGSPFWGLGPGVWAAIGLIAALALALRGRAARLVAVGAFGLATMGALGYLEPYGVFHDSWRNVGLGQLALTPEHAEEARQIDYIGSSPVSFLALGVLSAAFPDTPAFLRAYPALCVLLYGAGVYLLATAFADAHHRRLPVDRERFGLLSVFAFLALAPLFAVRVNPAPQSLAFALMPFCLAALLKMGDEPSFRPVALAVFGCIILTHAITAAMVVSVAAGWMLVGRLWRRPEGEGVSTTTVLLYGSLFFSWLIYIGMWVLSPGSAFVARLLDVLNSGQHATVVAASTEGIELFLWVRRGALVGGALLAAAGLWVVVRSSRLAAARLAVWLAAAGAWFPFLLLGDFSDRGPLFASLPVALLAGLALSGAGWSRLRGPLLGLGLVTAVAAAITANTNHVGEVISRAELEAFPAIVAATPGQRISYSYVPPLAGDDRPVYLTNRVHAYSISAADNDYEQLTAMGSAIVISDQMRAAAEAHGPGALRRLETFEERLRADPRFELAYDSGAVRMYRAR